MIVSENEYLILKREITKYPRRKTGYVRGLPPQTYEAGILGTLCTFHPALYSCQAGDERDEQKTFCQ